MNIVGVVKEFFRLLKEGRLKRAIYLLYYGVYFGYYKVKGSHNGVTVNREDWDYLIILDACRYDIFKDLVSKFLPKGKLEKKISEGSTTIEWLKKNFNEYYPDTIYVSANPYISDIGDFKASDYFFKVEKVWDYGWDENLQTVPPERVTKAALKSSRKHPDKKMIIHYIQPHAPYIGDKKIVGDKFSLRWNDEDPRIAPWGVIGEAIDVGIDLQEIKDAYKENLKLVLKECNNIVRELEGRIIISADHGELLGEKFLLGHPGGIYIKELVEVPWFTIRKPKTQNRETEKIRMAIRNL